MFTPVKELKENEQATIKFKRDTLSAIFENQDDAENDDYEERTFLKDSEHLVIIMDIYNEYVWVKLNDGFVSALDKNWLY